MKDKAKEKIWIADVSEHWSLQYPASASVKVTADIEAAKRWLSTKFEEYKDKFYRLVAPTNVDEHNSVLPTWETIDDITHEPEISKDYTHFYMSTRYEFAFSGMIKEVEVDKKKGHIWVCKAMLNPFDDTYVDEYAAFAESEQATKWLTDKLNEGSCIVDASIKEYNIE